MGLQVLLPEGTLTGLVSEQNGKQHMYSVAGGVLVFRNRGLALRVICAA
jgi:hypothetical protein